MRGPFLHSDQVERGREYSTVYTHETVSERGEVGWAIVKLHKLERISVSECHV